MNVRTKKFRCSSTKNLGCKTVVALAIISIFLAYFCLPDTANAKSKRAPKMAQPQDAGSEKAIIDSGNNPEQESFSLPIQRISEIEQQLWLSRIVAPKNPTPNNSKQELEQLIQQIRSVRFEKINETSTAHVITSLVPSAKQIEIISTIDQPQPSATEKHRTVADKELSYKPITEQTLLMLEESSHHPEKIYNPLGLAETLFLSGHLEQAARFYKQALTRLSPDNIESAQDRAWVMFQIGNCLRSTDPITAKNMYRQLITEYPNSPWTDLARAHERLIEWSQTDKPRDLITECRSLFLNSKSRTESIEGD